MAGNRNKKVAVVGAGVAGIAAALTLKQYGIDTDIFEKEDSPGGHLKIWHELFPEREDAGKVLHGLLKDVASDNLNIMVKSNITGIIREGDHFSLSTVKGESGYYDAVIIASGFTLFDAARKEEYGYGIYPRVITSPDLETRLAMGKDALLTDGKPPRRVAFIHCVGSRDAKAGNHYCSRVCCITGVKQAVAVRELYPDCEVFNFYMDLRMFGSGYEELYREAQEKYGINFIRGRVSEAGQTVSGFIVLKSEDTLLGRPLKLTADWVVLLIGMEPGKGHQLFSENPGIKLDQAGFIECTDKFLRPGQSSREGIFIAGTCSGPATIPETIHQGRSSAVSVTQFLSGLP